MQEQSPGPKKPGDQSETPSPGVLSDVPADLKVKIAEQRLLIEWKDGHRSDFSLDRLRRDCPCATCRTEREEHAENPLRILKTNPTEVRATHAELVGHYAIRLFWSDGHSSGIFDFRFLRRLVPENRRENRS